MKILVAILVTLLASVALFGWRKAGWVLLFLLIVAISLGIIAGVFYVWAWALA